MNDIITKKRCKCGCGEYVTSPKRDYLRGHSNRCEEVKKKKQEKFMEKYGVENPSQLQSVKKKKKDVSIKKYGSTCYLSSLEGREKIKRTMIEKYGVDNFFKTEEGKQIVSRRWRDKKDQYIEKIKNTNLDTGYEKIAERTRDGFIPLFNRDEYVGVGNIEYLFKCKECQSICRSDLNNGISPRCYMCNPLIDEGGTSDIEGELHAYILTLFSDVKFRDRKTIHPLELDVFIPEKNIAFELDGLYWHSQNNGRDKKYHVNKTKLCESVGVRLIHIFEDEWRYKQKIVKNRIRHILNKTKYKIYARKCTIREIDKNIKNEFLEKYHIRGTDRSSVCLGAFYKGRLVPVMTFGKLRKALGRTSREGAYELIRFCSIGSFNVIGIASKFLKYFSTNYNPLIIYSYADMRWSDGGVYKRMGFEHLHNSSPNYWYMKDYDRRMHRFGFQRHLLKKKLNFFDDSLSEWENMKNNGYDRIWDCGNMVFMKNITSKQ